MEKHNGHRAANPQDGSDYADGKLEQAPGADDSAFVAMLCGRFDLEPSTATEIYEEVWEHLGGAIPKTVGEAGGSSHLIKAIRQAVYFCFLGRTHKQICFRLGCLSLSLNMGDCFGVETAAALGVMFGFTKADATNYVVKFRAILKDGAGEMPPMPGQRTSEQRNKFRRKRKEQELRRGFDERLTMANATRIVERNGGKVLESETI
jgi:hypothetical protein